MSDGHFFWRRGVELHHLLSDPSGKTTDDDRHDDSITFHSALQFQPRLPPNTSLTTISRITAPAADTSRFPQNQPENTSPSWIPALFATKKPIQEPIRPTIRFKIRP